MGEGSYPLVTIGLPTFNGASYLHETLEALLSQDYPNFRVVISDNGSTDTTQRICSDFARRDDRIRYSRNARNLGASANFNRVVELAEGPYFAWASDDDLWACNYLSRCVAVLTERPEAVLAYTRAARIDHEGTLVAPLAHSLGLEGAEPYQRLRRYHDLFICVDREARWNTHEVEGLWTPTFGVVRLERLRATGAIGPYIGSDIVLLEELLMCGAFVEIEERLFFKRDHDERSMRACASYDQLIDWFAGETTGPASFPRWRGLIERISAVGRAPLSMSCRSACYREMIGFYLRRSREGRALIQELLRNGVRPMRPLTRRLARISHVRQAGVETK